MLKSIKDIRIETDRTFLKPLSLKDVAVFFKYHSQAEVYQYQSWLPENFEEARLFIIRYSLDSFIELEHWKQLGIYGRSDAVLLGDCGFCIKAGGQAEIGYTISPQYHRQGFGLEAVWALVCYLFETLGLLRLTAKTDPANIGSIKILKKIGFQQVALIEKNVKIRGEWKDDLVFTLLRKSSGNP